MDVFSVHSHMLRAPLQLSLLLGFVYFPIFFCTHQVMAFPGKAFPYLVCWLLQEGQGLLQLIQTFTGIFIHKGNWKRQQAPVYSYI